MDKLPIKCYNFIYWSKSQVKRHRGCLWHVGHCFVTYDTVFMNNRLNLGKLTNWLSISAKILTKKQSRTIGLKWIKDSFIISTAPVNLQHWRKKMVVYMFRQLFFMLHKLCLNNSKPQNQDPTHKLNRFYLCIPKGFKIFGVVCSKMLFFFLPNLFIFFVTKQISSLKVNKRKMEHRLQ